MKSNENAVFMLLIISNIWEIFLKWSIYENIQSISQNYVMYFLILLQNMKVFGEI